MIDGLLETNKTKKDEVLNYLFFNNFTLFIHFFALRLKFKQGKNRVVSMRSQAHDDQIPLLMIKSKY